MMGYPESSSISNDGISPELNQPFGVPACMEAPNSRAIQVGHTDPHSGCRCAEWTPDMYAPVILWRLP